MIDDRTPNLDLPLPNEDNTLLEDVPRLREALTTLDAAVFSSQDTAEKGQPNGYASLNSSGLVPAAQLPAYVDDVIEVANYAALPGTGETGKIYVTLDNNKIYRWGGSAYFEVVASPGSTDEVPEGITNKYFTDSRARAAQNIATSGQLGLVKIGSTLTIDGAGLLDVAGGGGSEQTFTESAITPSTNGQTVFTISGGYVPGRIELFLNGTLLYGGGDDYTASNGTSITLTVGANTVDTLLLRKWATFESANHIAKSGDAMTGALGFAPAVTVAISSGTADIGAANSNNVTVTGSGAITALGIAAAGATRKVVFSGTPTLTHNATSLILLTGENQVIVAGSTAEFLSLGSGNWRCLTLSLAGPVVAPISGGGTFISLLNRPF